MTMLLEMAKAVGGFLVLMAGWMAVQGFIRKRAGCGAGEDVLEHMAHGCGGCGTGHCAKRGKS